MIEVHCAFSNDFWPIFITKGNFFQVPFCFLTPTPNFSLKDGKEGRWRVVTFW